MTWKLRKEMCIYHMQPMIMPMISRSILYFSSALHELAVSIDSIDFDGVYTSLDNLIAALDNQIAVSGASKGSRRGAS